MKRTAFMVAGVASLIGIHAADAATADTVIYRNHAPWVLDPPIETDSSVPTDAAARFIYLDNQVHVTPDGTEQDYTAYRLKILKPEGLPAGNLTLAWLPDSGSMTVHYVRLIRNGQTTDILAATKFTVIQREAALEQSMLTGQRTATLQIPGLQVGDEIAVAVTVDKRETGFGGRIGGISQMPVEGAPGVFRFRLVSPVSSPIQWRIAKDLPQAVPTAAGDQKVLDITLRDPSGAIPTEGAPVRYNIRRLIEYSDFGTWPDVSRQLAPLFEQASNLSKASPIKAEVAAIVARTRDPAERAEAALQLVQDRIRYVFIALNGGNYVPASADETWQRRFGDCKAKTVLLIAILKGLGIEAEPALVNSHGGDGFDERLPDPRIFDHVIVRAVVAGKVVWLDGTRLGDRHLDNLPQPYRWALPLTVPGVALEKLTLRDTDYPLLTEIVDIDATAGVDHDAHVHVRNIMRGDEAFVVRTQLAALTPADADRALKTYWHQQVDWIMPDKVSWSYDERRAAINLELTGTGNPGWKGDDAAGHNLTILGAGFYPPDPLRRPSDQDQSAPYTVEFPRFRCWATTILLPKAGAKFAWSLYAEPMSRRLGGVLYWRNTGMSRNVVRTVMSSHSYKSEATAIDAAAANRAIPNFNNNMSSITEEVPSNVIAGVNTQLPFGDDVDWLNKPTPCSPPD